MILTSADEGGRALTPLQLLEARAAALPTDPGVYLFKNARGKVLYVGKARNLRARVRQYLSGQDERLMVPYLVAAARDIGAVVVRTDKEALILENSLIKEHRPRYNVKLVDDASFLHLRIDRREPWPRYQLVRHIQDTEARHFGPFTSASRARATLDFLNRRFPLRTCTDRELQGRQRPCLLHQMGRCIAPCVQLCTPEEYADVVDQSVLFLEGRNDELQRRLAERMEAAAEDLKFEEAARLRDLLRAIQATVERQTVMDRKLGDRDAWGIVAEGARGAVALVPVRQGMMQEAVTWTFDAAPDALAETLSSLINTWYDGRAELPPEILLSEQPSDHEALAEVLADRRGARLQLRVPQRGDKVGLVEIAVENARTAVRRAEAGRDDREQALAELQRLCRLQRPPRRIECFDNSNIQGSDPVAAMAVFVDGQAARGEYRRYRVKTVVGADDYASMAEILGRRLRRGLAEGSLPDLIVVDGGKGQLNAARAIFDEVGLAEQLQQAAGVAGDRPVVGLVGLVKPRTEQAQGDREALDKIVLPGIKNVLRPPASSRGLRLLQALRDETHDTAIRYHRKVRSRRTLTSVLDGLPGVGATRRKALLVHFGTVAAVRSATVDALAEVPGFGPRLAEQVHGALVAEWASDAPEGAEDDPGEG